MRQFASTLTFLLCMDMKKCFHKNRNYALYRTVFSFLYVSCIEKFHYVPFIARLRCIIRTIFVLCYMWHIKGNGSYVLFVPYLAHTHILIKIKIIFLKVVFMHFD